jgi:hypothetical protein
VRAACRSTLSVPSMAGLSRSRSASCTFWQCGRQQVEACSLASTTGLSRCQSDSWALNAHSPIRSLC